MRTSSAGIWIIGLLLLGPVTIILALYLFNVVTMPPCAEQWAAWCGEPNIVGTSLPRWSVTSKATELLHAALLTALFLWPSFQILRAARTRQPLSPRMRYGVIAAIIVWAVLLEV